MASFGVEIFMMSEIRWILFGASFNITLHWLLSPFRYVEIISLVVGPFHLNCVDNFQLYLSLNFPDVWNAQELCILFPKALSALQRKFDVHSNWRNSITIVQNASDTCSDICSSIWGSWVRIPHEVVCTRIFNTPQLYSTEYTMFRTLLV